MAQVQLVITVSNDQLQDLNTHWCDQKSPLSVVPSGDVDATSNPATINLSAVDTRIVPGVSIMINSEPFKVSVVSGTTVTATRGASAFPISGVQVVHPSGSPCFLMKYSDTFEMVDREALRTYAISISTNLAQQNRSAVFSATAQGTYSAT